MTEGRHGTPCLRALAAGLLFAALGVVPSSGETPSVTRVEAPSDLVALPMHVGGRSLTESSTKAPEADGTLVQSQWPGAYFDAAFRGSEVFFRVGPNHEILHVALDGGPSLVLQKPAPGLYRLSGMRKARHTVRLLVATESQDAPNSFGGFALRRNEQALPPPSHSRQIEFIGDSHTVGYGNTSTKRDCTADEVWATTDNTQAFGPLLAARYDAEYQVNAISGRGVVRNYNNFVADKLPVVYPFTLFNKEQTYHDASWQPELIVIALGTNDFSTALKPDEPWKTRQELHADYEATYLHFLQSLRAAHPAAYLVLWATDMAHGEIEAEVQKVVDRAKAGGETRLDFLPMDHLTFTGCHNHPSLTDDKVIESRLAQWVEAHPDLWQGK